MDDDRDFAIVCGVNIVVVIGVVMIAAYLAQVWK